MSGIDTPCGTVRRSEYDNRGIEADSAYRAGDRCHPTRDVRSRYRLQQERRVGDDRSSD